MARRDGRTQPTYTYLINSADKVKQSLALGTREVAH